MLNGETIIHQVYGKSDRSVRLSKSGVSQSQPQSQDAASTIFKQLLDKQQLRYRLPASQSIFRQIASAYNSSR